jgi:hypothetical protein
MVPTRELERRKKGWKERREKGVGRREEGRSIQTDPTGEGFRSG